MATTQNNTNIHNIDKEELYKLDLLFKNFPEVMLLTVGSSPVENWIGWEEELAQAMDLLNHKYYTHELN